MFHHIIHIRHVFIHTAAHGHLGGFHILAVGKSAAMDIGVHASFGTTVFSGYKPSSGIAGSYGGILLISGPERYYSSERLQCTQLSPSY